jgi:hypothetical protein
MINHAEKFLFSYKFNFQTGEWNHQNSKNSESNPISLYDLTSLAEPLKCSKFLRFNKKLRTFIKQAYRIIKNTDKCHEFATFETELEEMMFFYVVNYGR